MQIVNYSDSELIELLEKGNQSAYETIYKKYWRSLYGFIYQIVGSKEDTEEIIHDLMLSLWLNRQKSKIQNLKVYLFIAARNLSNKFIISKINLRKYKEYQILHEVFENYNTEEIINSQDLSVAIDKVLSLMPEKTSKIFKMSKIEELPVKKIALKMNLTDKAVEYHITKSMKAIRTHLQNHFSIN